MSEAAKLVTVRIDRPHWGQESLLKTLPSKKGSALCCLGFCSLRAGNSRNETRGMGRPSDNDNLLPAFAKTFPLLVQYDKADEIYYEQPVMDALIDANDSGIVTWKEREKEIRAIGLRAGIRFVFSGKYAPWQRKQDANVLKGRAENPGQ